jgi:hypothetical protein
LKSRKEKNTGTFIIKILDRQNASWQGSVTWAEEGRTQNFRSALELLKLIDGALDGALDDGQEIEGGSHER